MAHKPDNLTVSILSLGFAAVVVGFIVQGRSMTGQDAGMPVLPEHVQDWRLAKTVPIPEEFLQILGTKTAVLGEYCDDAGTSVQLYILRSNGRRSTIHQPEYCYLGSGKNELLKKGTLSTEIASGKRIPMNYLFIQTDHGFQTVLYFYTVNEVITNNYYLQQFLFLANRLKNKKVEGSLVRISRNSKNNSFTDDTEYLQLFATQLLAVIGSCK
jgi:EpsI family protein